MRFGLTGGMIPRQVKRLFDQREEPRLKPDAESAVLQWRKQSILVTLGNLSPSGAMIHFDQVPRIGERITLQMLDHGPVVGQVRWVRAGQVGINFVTPRG